MNSMEWRRKSTCQNSSIWHQTRAAHDLCDPSAVEGIRSSSFLVRQLYGKPQRLATAFNVQVLGGKDILTLLFNRHKHMVFESKNDLGTHEVPFEPPHEGHKERTPKIITSGV